MASDEALTAQQIEHFRTLLVEERTAAEGRMEERDAEIPPTVRQDDDDPGDYADDAAALAERERLLNESDYDSELVDKIDHALDRLREGTYGVSELSGARIPVERLEAVPWATTLVGEEPTEDD